jgi:thioredoxin reductase
VSSARAAESVAVVGAGPYGLAAAAHLRQVGIETQVFGEPMQFWREQMPNGMLLRSRLRSSHIADPGQLLKLEDFAQTQGRKLSAPLTRTEFLEYGRWFQSRAVPDVDTRRVKRIEPGPAGGFKLVLEDGQPTFARSVAVAGGIGPFAWRPAPFDALPRALVSHSSEHQDFERFRGLRVLVVGAGQSALESAVLLNESGAEVEVVARGSSLRWLGKTIEHSSACVPLIHPPPTDVGGRVLGWVVAAPDVYRRVPSPLKKYFPRTYRPAGAWWLRARLAHVPITTGRTVTSVVRQNGRLCVRLNDGTERHPDHVLLGTGYRINVGLYDFLGPEVQQSLRVVNGYPCLGAGLESSIAGLHFLGAPAAMSFGPIMRFVVGTWYAAPALTRRILGKPQPLMRLSFAH